MTQASNQLKSIAKHLTALSKQVEKLSKQVEKGLAAKKTAPKSTKEQAVETLIDLLRKPK